MKVHFENKFKNREKVGLLGECTDYWELFMGKQSSKLPCVCEPGHKVFLKEVLDAEESRWWWSWKQQLNNTDDQKRLSFALFPTVLTSSDVCEDCYVRYLQM